MGTVILADVSELETIKISELDETLSTGVHDVLPVVKDGKTQKVKKPNLVHTQNTDTKLDEGGANEISVTEIPKKATANITYYVAPDGDDETGNGTTENPFATAQHAVDLFPKALNGYDAITIFKDGTYPEGEIEVSDFIQGAVYFWSASYNADAVLIEAPSDKYFGFTLKNNSAYVYIGMISVRIQRNIGVCIQCENCSYVDVDDSKVGDNGNSNTMGIRSRGSIVTVTEVIDIDANKVSTGVHADYGGVLALSSEDAFGDTFSSVADGGLIHSGIRLIKADYDDAITKKHTPNTDTALGAQSEDLDMNIHKIINVVDPVNDQDAITKLFASNMAINGGVF